MTDGATVRDLNSRPHSYRGFTPHEFTEALENAIETEGEIDGRQQARQSLARVESARLDAALEAISSFFTRLDRDEQEAFTERNPDMVQWMSAYNTIHELNPYDGYRQHAASRLTDDDRAMRPDVTPPPYTRDAGLAGLDLIRDLAHRRRSYRNFSPEELIDVSDMGKVDVPRGIAAELSMWTREIREELDFPVDVTGKQIARAVFDRIESGRFKPMLKAVHRFFVPLDPDERQMFADRNPGLVMWISAWGYSEDQIWGDQLFVRSSPYPTLRTVAEGDSGAQSGRGSDGGSDTPEHIGSADALRAALEPFASDGVTFTRHSEDEATFDWKLPPAADAPFASSLTYDPTENLITGVALRFPPNAGRGLSDRRFEQRLDGVLEASDPPGGTIWTTYISGDAQVSGPHILGPGGFSKVDPDEFVAWLPRVLDEWGERF